jgi:hypothetical protein
VRVSRLATNGTHETYEDASSLSAAGLTFHLSPMTFHSLRLTAGRPFPSRLGHLYWIQGGG